MHVLNLNHPGTTPTELMRLAAVLSAKHDLPIVEIHTDMTSGDWNHMVAVFRRHFSEWVTLTEHEYIGDNVIVALQERVRALEENYERLARQVRDLY